MAITTDDRDLTLSDVQTLSSRDGVAAFFAALGYNTDARLQQTAAAMGITAESLQRHVTHIERLAAQENGAEPLEVYLLELVSVTVAATQGIAKALRNRAGNYLLVLTDDYEHLDFVLLERSLPSPSDSPMVARNVLVRPRILTVNRRTIAQGSVHLRVLRRFTCTEADADAQYEKLLSAYAVADWSEPLFNNRALFSDYYLMERLSEHPEWRERPEEAYHRVRELMTGARQRSGRQPRESELRELIHPVLETLGFTVLETVSASGDTSPFLRIGAGQTCALCLAYSWNRNLDGRDVTRDTQTPDDYPAARVVTLLQSEEVPWAILTNGKLWRLYSAKAHSRSTNYYEIDLEETLAMADPNLAFRYFWLFFRAAAFEPRDVQAAGETRRLSFLEEVVAESEDYAKSLGENLKKHVFEEVFPHFARGFIEHLRAQPLLMGAQQGTLLPVAQQLALRQEPDEEFRRQVFQATLTFLYRLLFLLYAESRDLLPAREVRGYWEHSLARMKEEVAGKAGDIVDEAPARLRTAYSIDSTALYDRLLELFVVVDRGSVQMNVPLYNGGLFMTRPEESDHTPEAENARFLLQHKIPDRYLAMGLDLLARDEDPKRGSLVSIDYKSMGVRQLGSIYEGLLEFKVRVAPGKMAVVQGKKTDQTVPYSEVVAEGRKILTTGRGRDAEELVMQAGDVYLENDRRERKATGSYYTPDHIVKYIVEHAVGPVLEERLEKLRPAFREAQEAYRRKMANAEAFRRHGIEPDDPSKLAITYEQLVDQLFDLRVLDPAMGSGHFLVEAVDFICDRIIGQREGFLQAFPGNPVTTFLYNTRASILAEMERQGVSIDPSRLTDINLLKRHVLKRCIYGVDLNPMAVELAKVSLWLDCFTLGAPLSFLDHHLKCGDSLLGTTVQEVQTELVAQKKGHVADLFGGPFQGLLNNTATMLEIARSPDATAEQAGRSRSLFAGFEEDQLPYRRTLDLWTSHHFGNPKAREYLTLVGRDFVQELRSGGAGTSTVYREVIQKAGALAAEKRFFHWDLEFPEAFVDLDRADWKPKEKQGFHAVIGNPPYDVLGGEGLNPATKEELAYYEANPKYEPACQGARNIYKLFVCRSVGLLVSCGQLSFILPMTLLGDDQAARLRKVLLERSSLVSIDAFPQKDDPRKRVFPEAKLATAVVVARNAAGGGPVLIRSHPARHVVDASPVLRVTADQVQMLVPGQCAIPTCTQKEWEILTNIWSNPVQPLGRLAECFRGDMEETKEIAAGTLSASSRGAPVLRGSNITLYAVREASQGTPLFLDVGRFLSRIDSRSKAARNRGKRKVGYQRSAPQNNFRRLIAAPVSPECFCLDTVSYVTEESTRLNLDLLLAFLNSKVLEWVFRLSSTNSKVNEYQFNNLPIPVTCEQGPSPGWNSALVSGRWSHLQGELCAGCTKPGEMPAYVADAIIAMSRAIQEVEAKRVLKNRSERSRLAPESKVIQDVIDAVLFRCYGISDDDAVYIEQRLKEML